jgi:hypothetical protein
MHTGFWWETRRKEATRETYTWIEENNIKMDLRDIELGGMDWIYLAQDRDQ